MAGFFIDKHIKHFCFSFQLNSLNHNSYFIITNFEAKIYLSNNTHAY